MSKILSIGFDGVSSQIIRVVGRSAARHPGRDRVMSTKVASMPSGFITLSKMRNVPPYTSSPRDHVIARAQHVEQGRRRARTRFRTRSRASPPSSAARHPSSACARRVAAARVFVALVSAGPVLRERAGEDDGRHHRADVGSGSCPAWMASVSSPSCLVSRIGLL